MRKPRVLWVGESSFLATGYAVYGREVLSRLHASGKYEIYELGCYGPRNDGRAAAIPWRYMPVMPDPGDRAEVDAYNGCQTNQFGEWKFERACLWARPDIVITYKDWWMDEFVQRSPYRGLFRWAWMPTVDSAPQAEEWVASFMSADAVFTYSDWGLDVLRREGGGRIPLKCSAPPGADFDSFRVLDRRAHRKQMGVDEDALVVGTTMRNQKRKLFPDLVRAFARYLEVAPPDLARRTYLYLHTSWPDVGWDIPRLLTEEGVGSRTLFTYMCRSCGHVSPAFFQDAVGHCRRCGERSATFPKPHLGVSTADLGRVMALFDCHVQYAMCLKPGTEVLLGRGWTPVERVAVGDTAFTHTGSFRRVSRTFHNQADATVDIALKGDYETLTVTGEHPVYAIRAADVPLAAGHSLREGIGDRIRQRRPVPEPRFVAADSLAAGDLVAYRVDDAAEDVARFDLAAGALSKDFVAAEFVAVRGGKAYPRYFDADEAFCRFAGLFVADGSCGMYKSRATGYLAVTCNEKDRDNVELAEAVLGRLNGSPASVNKYSGRKAVDVAISSRAHARMFREWFYGDGKRLPDWAMKMPVPKQREIVRGLFMGDGHYSNTDKQNVSIFVTTSPTLAGQLKELLRRCRLYFNVRRVRKGAPRLEQYRFEVPGNVAGGEFVTRRSSSNSFYLGDFHFMQVKSVSPSDYRGDVFNFEVEGDNSYMTRVGVVHNCEGFGIPLVEAAACGVPVFAVDYSAMSDVVRKLEGFPVRVARMVREAETHCWRAYPDNDHLVELLVDFLRQPESVRAALGMKAHLACRRHYDYDRTASIWMDHLDSVPLRDWASGWGSPARAHAPETRVPAGMGNDEFVRWGIQRVAGLPELADSYMAMRLARDLNWGARLPGMGGLVFNEASTLGVQPRFQEFDREKCLNELAKLAERKNHWERERAALPVEA